MQKSLQSTYACRGHKYSPTITDKKEGQKRTVFKKKEKRRKEGLLRGLSQR